ncbi:MAG: hypothetical protein FWE40_06715 [Oscillospiraceae bacterium]|nr:hypothetical protein [Oscillospiraceae bacterium]
MKIEKYFAIDQTTAQQMIKAIKRMTHERSGDNRFQNTKAFLFDEHVVLKMQNINVRNVATQDPDLKHLERLAKTLLELQAQGVNVVPISAVKSKNGNGYIIQPRAKGSELYDRDETSCKSYVLKRVELLSNAPQGHFDKYVADIIKITDAGIIIDFVGKDNFFYHETIGFQFIDLNAHNDYEYGLSDEKTQGKQAALRGCFLPCYFDAVPKYRNTVSLVLDEMSNSERAILTKHNQIIFNKCKAAAINNGITEKMICEMLANEWFIPQKQQLELA